MIPPGYRLAMWCDPDLAIAKAVANQDHGLDGYVGEALILILILAKARFTSICSWARPMSMRSMRIAGTCLSQLAICRNQDGWVYPGILI